MKNAKMEKLIHMNSSAFYTGYPGYQLCMRVVPNHYETGRGNRVGVSLVIIKGDFDHQLHWPFSYSYRLTVIDQQPNGKNMTKLIDPTKEPPDSKRHSERKTKSLVSWGFLTVIVIWI